MELKTKRLLLRPLQPDDAGDLFVMHADTEVMRFSNEAPWSDISRALRLIAAAQEWLTSGRHLCLGISRRDAGKIIGTCTLFDINLVSKHAEVGFLLSRQHWGSGYMREALIAMVEHAFGRLELNRIDADTDPKNNRSIELLESLQFRREGLLRERWIVGGRKSDTALYGLLRSDWEAVRAGG